jgi:hypothetical protein
VSIFKKGSKVRSKDFDHFKKGSKVRSKDFDHFKKGTKVRSKYFDHFKKEVSKVNSFVFSPFPQVSNK